MLPLTWDYIDEKLRLLDLGSLEVWGASVMSRAGKVPW